MFDLDTTEKTKQPQIIVYNAKFFENTKLLHSAKCDFEIIASRLDFKTCPILSAIIRANVPHNVQIGNNFNIYIKLQSTSSAILPKGIDGLAGICKNCALKHKGQKNR